MSHHGVRAHQSQPAVVASRWPAAAALRDRRPRTIALSMDAVSSCAGWVCLPAASRMGGCHTAAYTLSSCPLSTASTETVTLHAGGWEKPGLRLAAT